MLRRTWKTEMTASETQRGLVFFLLYLLAFPRLNAWVQRLLMGDGETLVAEANVVYYIFLFALTLFIFWGFLKGDFFRLLDWLPENLFSLALGFLAAAGSWTLLRLLPFPVEDPISAQYAQEFLAAPGPTLILILLLIPLVEETLYRGLIYGHLRNYSRPLGFVFSTLFSAFAQMWRYALDYGDSRYLLLTVLYLLPAAALHWCYDRGGSVWSCALLHSAFHGFMLFISL